MPYANGCGMCILEYLASHIRKVSGGPVETCRWARCCRRGASMVLLTRPRASCALQRFPRFPSPGGTLRRSRLGPLPRGASRGGIQIAQAHSTPAVAQGTGKAWPTTRLGTMPITFDDTEEPSDVSYLDKHAHPDLRRPLPHRHVRPGADGWGRGDGECGQWRDRPRDSGRPRQ